LFKFNKEKIEGDFLKAERVLMSKINIIEIIYDDFQIESFDKNQKELLSKISGKPIVYCLWTGDRITNFKPKYIGHTSPNISRQRIRAHLTKKNKATGAQLSKIKTLLKEKQPIGLSYLEIFPGYMRKSLEDWLINKYSNQLEWNRIGKNSCY